MPQTYPCPRCEAAVPTGVPACPACGWQREGPARKAQRPRPPVPPTPKPVPAPDPPPRRRWWPPWG